MPRRLTARERFARVVAKDSNVAVARSLGISESYVVLLKQGQRDPSGAVAARIQRTYGIPAVDWYVER